MSEPGQYPPDGTPSNAGWQPPTPPSTSQPGAGAPTIVPAEAAPPGTIPPGTTPPHGTTVPGEQVPHIGPPIEPQQPPTPPEDQVVFGMESKATRTLMIFCSAVALLVLLGGAVTLFVGHFRTDSGVSECKQAASMFGKTDTNTTSGTFTEKAYHALRDPFQKSRYSDVRDAGTRLADEIWQLAGNGRQPSISDIGVLEQVESTYGDLAHACANHGVTLPPLTGN